MEPYALTGSDRLSTRRGTESRYTGGLDIKYGLRSNLVVRGREWAFVHRAPWKGYHVLDKTNFSPSCVIECS